MLTPPTEQYLPLYIAHNFNFHLQINIPDLSRFYIRNMFLLPESYFVWFACCAGTRSSTPQGFLVYIANNGSDKMCLVHTKCH